MLQQFTVPTPDGQHFSVAVEGLGPQNKLVLSHVINLNEIRLGYSFSNFTPEAVDVINGYGEPLASIGVRGICERDLWDWLLLCFPVEWEALNFRWVESHRFEDGKLHALETMRNRARVSVIDEQPSCVCLGFVRSSFFRDLVKKARAEMLRTLPLPWVAQ